MLTKPWAVRRSEEPQEEPGEEKGVCVCLTDLGGVGGDCLYLGGEARGLRQCPLDVPARFGSRAPFTMDLSGVGVDHCSHQRLAVGPRDSVGVRARMAR